MALVLFTGGHFAIGGFITDILKIALVEQQIAIEVLMATYFAYNQEASAQNFVYMSYLQIICYLRTGFTRQSVFS